MQMSKSISPAEVQELRAEFPYFERLAKAPGQPIAYLDSAATSQRPRVVLDAEREFLERHNAAVARGTSNAVGAATEAFETARAKVADFVGANSPSEIVWAENA